ncbi:hypothetical protein B0J18DRAFT_302997 [Chaetomium sp. MPI-SDFR-AT-0129]|nr:hypothetical protein B0J18DRAFT_302997 [Chaetomium sp. MPI-SDFR-AT-0129]
MSGQSPRDMNVADRFNQALRRESKKPKSQASQVRCPACDQVFPPSSKATAFKKHYLDEHAQLLDPTSTAAESSRILANLWDAAARNRSTERDVIKEDVPLRPARPARPSRTTSAAATTATSPLRDDRASTSPVPSMKREGSRSVSPPKRTRSSRPVPAAEESESPDVFDRGPYQKNSTATPLPRPYDKSNVASQPRQRPSSGSAAKAHRQTHTLPSRSQPPPPTAVNENGGKILKQPETRPISQEQLVAEVKGIYAGLVMVENKCIEVDTNQSNQPATTTKLNNDQWQALIALHRTLLHEHHDFFLASQHPSASAALRRLAAKYAMPARMWRHGIHSFLELLRHRLPASLDHMLTFIYMAYSMMALLYETVPAFEDTWIECLGDLGRYRMAIEDDDIRDREVWTAVSRHWYSRASDKSPRTGRLYHHLAILARPNALQQLSNYAKSLCVEIPFVSARESIMTLFEPLMSKTRTPQQNRLSSTELNFVKAHGILFSGKQLEDLDSTMKEFFDELDDHINVSTRSWLAPAYHMPIANICGVTGYGDKSNPISIALKAFIRSPPEDQSSNDTSSTTTGPKTGPSSKTGNPVATTTTGTSKPTATPQQFYGSLRLFLCTYDIVCRRFGDQNILPYLHVTLAFIYHLTFLPDTLAAYFAPVFPWKLTKDVLNTLLGPSSSSRSEAAPKTETKKPKTEETKGSKKTAGADGTPDGEETKDVHYVSEEVLEACLEGKYFLGDEQRVRDSDNSSTEEAGKEKKVASAPKQEKGDDEKTAKDDLSGEAATQSRRTRNPLPDDYAMRGFPWVEKYFPNDWFTLDERDDDKYFEVPSMLQERRERIVWLGCRIAEFEGGRYLQFDRATKRFAVHPDYDADLDMRKQSLKSVRYEGPPDAGAVA